MQPPGPSGPGYILGNEMQPSGILETITHAGQEFVDDPVWADPKSEFISPIATAIAGMFGRKPPKPIKVGYARVQLNWMKPDKNGKLIPK